MMYKKGERADHSVRALVAYFIEKGETLEGAIEKGERIINPALPKMLRRKIITAYCENANPKKATKVYDPASVRVKVVWDSKVFYTEDPTGGKAKSKAGEGKSYLAKVAGNAR